MITRYHLRELFTGKGRVTLILLLVVSGVLHLGFLGVIYLLSNLDILALFRIPTQALPKIEGEFFLTAFAVQSVFVGLLSLIVGSGLIADDRRDNTIPLYLSKPLTAGEYILGKFAVLAVFILGITAAPINLLFSFEVLIHGGWEFLKEYWWLPLSITAYSLLVTGLCGAAMLMASSLVTKGSLAGVVAIGLYIGHNAVAGMFSEATSSTKALVFSLHYDLMRAGFWLFDLPIEKQMPRGVSGPAAALMILAVTVVCLAVVWWRVRPVEVVK